MGEIMTTDWNIVATIASPIIALFIGAFLNHLVENRPKLISYLGHVSGIRITREPLIHVNTHSLVLRNAGRKTANNVRLGHATLPDFQIFPDIEYEVKELPGGQKEIVIPKLVPKKQVTITYLYFPPLTWNQINSHLESDEGPVKVLNVLPTVQLPKWLITILWILIGYGVIGVAYTGYELLKWLAQ
jgi:hypothetical protein